MKRLDQATKAMLIQHYAKHGWRSTEKLAVKYGTNVRYVSDAARKHGVYRCRRDNSGICRHTFHDPRWERAKAIGVVTI